MVAAIYAISMRSNFPPFTTPAKERLGKCRIVRFTCRSFSFSKEICSGSNRVP